MGKRADRLAVEDNENYDERLKQFTRFIRELL
jgi:hypothetical protein